MVLRNLAPDCVQNSPTSEHHCVSSCIVLLVQLECQGFVSEESLGYVVRASCRCGESFRAPEKGAYSNLY